MTVYPVKAVAFVFVVFASTSVDAIGVTLQYEPAVVQLTGTVRFEKHYGPPNFGGSPRTDSQVTAPVLILENPIDVEGSRAVIGDPMPLNGTSYRGVTRLQLVTAGPSKALAQFDGKHVSISGSLFQKISAQNYTDVLLTVTELRLVDR